MASNEELAAKVRNALRLTGEGFEAAFPSSTGRFVAAIAPAFGNLLAALDRFGEMPERDSHGSRGNEFLAWQLLWDACNALLASFTLLQRGYATETLAVLRGVFERIACALVLFDNPELVPRFRAGQLGDLGTRAIGPASRVINGFAHWVGMLSELGTHVGVGNCGTGFVTVKRDQEGTEVEMAIGGVVVTEGPRADGWSDMVPVLCSIAEQLLAVAPDQIFFNPKRRRAGFRNRASTSSK